jgi:hypothetical protein
LPFVDPVVEAKAYEQALRMAEELCEQHRKITWDVGKITELLTYQSNLWEQIRTTRRQKPEYYRVVSPMFTNADASDIRHTTATFDPPFVKARSISCEVNPGSNLAICTSDLWSQLRSS